MRRPALAVACALMGFLLVVAATRAPAGDPESRLPERYRLAGLIEREGDTVERLRGDAAALREAVGRARRAAASRRIGAEEADAALAAASLVAGLTPVEGPGLRVVLDDADPPDGADVNVNDLVVHSEDVHAVLNALWRAGARAVAVNDERVVATSGVLCVGNTLLVNGTVHAPPYELVGVGAARDRFEADALVERVRADADAFGLRVSVDEDDDLVAPAYDGAVAIRAATPVA